MRTREVEIHRGETVERTIFSKARKPLSRTGLQARLAPIIREWLRAACIWDGGEIGDYRFVVFSSRVAPDVDVYIQFWSEPLDTVLWEVSSGRWNPPADEWPEGERSRLIERFGFEIGGDAENYQQEVTISGAADLSKTARTVVDILYSAFEYRGATPIEAKLVYEGRSEPRSTYDAFSPDDVAKIFAACGFRVDHVTDADDKTEQPLLRCRKRGIETIVSFDDEVEDEELYGRVTFTADLELSEAEAEEAARTLPPPPEEGLQPIVTLTAAHPFSGGVTIDWLAERITEWELVTTAQRREARRQKKGVHDASTTVSPLGRQKVH